MELGVDPAVAGGSSGGGDNGDLPAHSIRVGDIVGIRDQVSSSSAAAARKKKDKEEDARKKEGVDGVVLKVAAARVSVALDKEDVELPGGRLWLCVRCLRERGSTYELMWE